MMPNLSRNQIAFSLYSDGKKKGLVNALYNILFSRSPLFEDFMHAGLLIGVKGQWASDEVSRPMISKLLYVKFLRLDSFSAEDH